MNWSVQQILLKNCCQTNQSKQNHDTTSENRDSQTGQINAIISQSQSRHTLQILTWKANDIVAYSSQSSIVFQTLNIKFLPSLECRKG